MKNIILGNTECDHETGYFLEYGKYPPIKEKECIFAPAEFDWEKANEPDTYYCWQGTRLPQWFE